MEKDIADIASCENTVAKLGGFAMPDNGMGWMGRGKPPTSDEVVAAQAAYYLHIIECFSPDRCMFESNFPVDKLSLSYQVFFNAMKKSSRIFQKTKSMPCFTAPPSRFIV